MSHQGWTLRCARVVRYPVPTSLPSGLARTSPERHHWSISETSQTQKPGPVGRTRSTERRTYWIAAIVLFGSIAILTTASVFTDISFGPRKDTLGQLQENGGAKPHIIPRPGEGQAPKHPNDRGGWQQFMILGIIVGALGTVGGLAWRSSVRARAKAAAAGLGPPDSGPTTVASPRSPST